MKNTKFLFQTTFLAFLILFSLTSCEVDNEESLVEEEQVIDQEQLIDPNTEVIHIENASMRLTNQNARRYYSGSLTVHTYKLASSGSSIGSYEGIAFSTPVISVSVGYDTNKYTTLYFFRHPLSQDFVMTTSAREFWDLDRKGWRRETFGRPLVQKRAGNGKVPLHRFYSSSNSDHLFTKNYSEGIRAGYKYEGITGYVN